MVRKIGAWAVGIFLFVAPKFLYAVQESQMGCGFEPDSVWQQQIAAADPTDTVTVAVIWAVGLNPPIDTANKMLPFFWRRMFDSSQSLSVPRFFKENSDSKYILNFDVFSAADSFCFRSSLNPSGNSGGHAFTKDILKRADSIINFVPYDRNGDKVVDPGMIFIAIAWDNVHAGTQTIGLDCGADSATFTTNDVVGGDSIKIKCFSGVTFRVPSQEEGVQLACHQKSHLLGLVYDYYARDPNEWWVSGSFSVMGYTGFQFRASPFLPFQNHKFIGWNQPIDVNSSSYDQQIGDYMPTKQFYRIKRNNNEYFEVSYHRRVSFWEANWPAQGVLIAHIVDTVSSPLRKDLKQFDLELPHGLRDTSGGAFGSNANDSLGADSLDLFYPYWNKNPTTREAGSQTCLWPATISDSTKKNFDDKTNPSSRVYQFQNNKWMQNVPSKIAIEDIKINGPTASADLILNAQYGRIKTNTTLGPGLVSVIGDLTVDSGVTMTIAAGTTLKFQQNYDNQLAGVTNKAELVVDTFARLVIAGTVANPVKLISSSATPGTDDWRGIVVRGGSDTLAPPYYKGGVLSCSNAVIRDANRGIEFKEIVDTSSFLLKVRVARCKLEGIRVSGMANGLRITNCRVDSISDTSGYGGISFFCTGNFCRKYPGARLLHDTVYACDTGLYLGNNSHRVDSCLVQSDTTGGLLSHKGIVLYDQQVSYDTVTITATDVKGYFTRQLVEVGLHGAGVLTNCRLISDSTPGRRTPTGIRNTLQNNCLKLRGCQILQWGDSAAVISGAVGSATISDVGSFPYDVGNNTFRTTHTGAGWHFIRNHDTTVQVKAEGNWFGPPVPEASQFKGPVDYRMSGHISQNATWPAGNYTIYGDVTVDSGKTWQLTAPSTIYALANADDEGTGVTNKTEIVVKGNLARAGSPTDSIKLLSSATTPGEQDWQGVKIDTFGSFSPSYYQFKNAYAALDYRNSASNMVQNCLFQKNFMYGVYSMNNNLQIQYNTFKDFPAGYGIFIDNASTGVSYNKLTDVNFGINANKSYGTFANNIIGTTGSNVAQFGFRAEGVVGTQRTPFSADTITGRFEQGGVVANGGITIDQSAISTVYTVSPPYPDPEPLEGFFGILAMGAGQAVVSNSSVHMTLPSYAAVPAVRVTGLPLIDLGKGGFSNGQNRILKASGSANKAVENWTAYTVKAESCWWGTASPPSSYFQGSVDYDPWRTSSPKIAAPEEEEEIVQIPAHFSLGQNFPNPFNPATTISFALPIAEKVTLTIYNLLGQRVLTLLDGEKPAGNHQVIWNGRDENGMVVASGLYFYKLETKSFRKVKRMLFVK